MSRTGTSTRGSASERTGGSGPKTPRRGTRAQRVSAAIVVIGLIGVIALLLSGVLGRDTGAQKATPSFPPPSPVITTTTVLHPARTGRITSWTLPEALVGPRDVAVDAAGVVWITEQNRGIVDSFADGTLTRHGTDAFPDVGAFTLGAGPGGTMWFTGYPGGSIGRILPDGTANGFQQLADDSATDAIAEGDGDVMWVTDSQRGLLIRVAPDAVVSQLPVPATQGSTRGNPQPRDIVRGNDGTMWFTDPGTGSVGSVSVGDVPTITEHPMTEGSQPRSIAVAPDGSLWVTDHRALLKVNPSDGSAEVVRLEAADAALNDLLVAPDGTIWVSEAGSYLLHVRTDGSTIERIKLPDGVRYADGIARSSDGTIWLAATDADMILSVAPRG